MQIDAAQQNAHTPPMSDVDEKRAQLRRKQLRQFIDARDLKIRAWCREAGLKSDGTVRNFLAGVTKSMTQETVAKLAAAEGVTPDQIFPPDDVKVDIHRSNFPKEGVATKNHQPLDFLPGRPTGPRDLPILGHTKAGETGFFIDQGQTWGFAMRPESLRGVDGAYAVRVHDDSMSPRYEPGEVLLVDPYRQAKPDDHVVIQLTDGQAFIKRLVRRGGGIVACAQLNPKKNIEYKQAQIKAIHLVVGVDYLER
jgi:phage repressor protein C with HTH and peptisase S24 domain